MEEVCHWFKSKRPHLLLVFSPCFALVVHDVSPSFCSNHHTFYQLPPSHPLESEAQTNPFFYKSWSQCLFAATEKDCNTVPFSKILQPCIQVQCDALSCIQPICLSTLSVCSCAQSCLLSELGIGFRALCMPGKSSVTAAITLFL